MKRYTFPFEHYQTSLKCLLLYRLIVVINVDSLPMDLIAHLTIKISLKCKRDWVCYVRADDSDKTTVNSVFSHEWDVCFIPFKDSYLLWIWFWSLGNDLYISNITTSKPKIPKGNLGLNI